MDELKTFLVSKINVNVGAEGKGNFITPRLLAWVPGEAYMCVVVGGGGRYVGSPQNVCVC